MKEIYLQLWELAKPYYLQGRPMDIDHVQWMMGDALLVCEQEGLDDSLLLPLLFLHDVGYSECPKTNPFELDLRRLHMKKGAAIAKKLLEKAKYPAEKVEKIVYYVSVHDNWAFGDNEVFKDKILGVFNDLDYLWMATPKGFEAIRKILKKNKKEMVDYLVNNPKPIERPFSAKTTKILYEKYLAERKLNFTF